MIYSIHPDQLKKAKAAWDEAAGMTANQWGHSKSIVIFSPDGYKDLENGHQNLEVLINPCYTPQNNSQKSKWEGCFSMPLTVCNVTRPTVITAKYQNIKGEWITKDLTGFPARVFQHETDHSNGCLCEAPGGTGKCLEKRTFQFKEEVDKFYKDLKVVR